MTIYAKGTYARAMCDRCGLEFAYLDLKEEWTGLRVCQDCLDPKTKQDFPDTVFPDPEALRNPRPDNDVEAHLGLVTTAINPIGNSFRTLPVNVELGTVTVVIS